MPVSISKTAHTLIIAANSPEPALIFFAAEGGFICLDKAADGCSAAYEDALEFV